MAYLDDKMVAFKEKMKQEEKNYLEREKKMLSNLQDGLLTVNDILKGINEQHSLNLSKAQTILTGSISNLSNTSTSKPKNPL